jgi:hypothetical protein
MNNTYLTIVNCLLGYLTLFICYQLALAFIGVRLPVNQVILPVLIFSVIAFISKICLNSSASVHTVVVVIVCTALLYLINKIHILFSFIGSLLSFITLTLGSMLLACPIFVKLGYVIPLKYSGLTWLYLSMLELVIPTIILVLMKISKFSLMKYVPITK